VGVGDYSIALAEQGFQVLGLEGSREAINEAKNKLKKTSLKNVRKNISFIGGDTARLRCNQRKLMMQLYLMNSSFIASSQYLCPSFWKSLTESFLKKMRSLLCSLAITKKQLNSITISVVFVVRSSKIESQWKHAYLWFYDPPEKKGIFLMLNVAIFGF